MPPAERDIFWEDERNRSVRPRSTCARCAGSDLPGYIDQTPGDQQGIHDWVPCIACNPNHKMHSQESMTRLGSRSPQVAGKVGMPDDFKDTARRLIEEGAGRAAKMRAEDLQRDRERRQ